MSFNTLSNLIVGGVVVENLFNEQSKHLIIRVDGRFDYSCHKMFRDAFMTAPPALTYEVDLSKVNYLDSSALGMLLLLRDHAKSGDAAVSLTHCSKIVANLLKMANFHRLFLISE